LRRLQFQREEQRRLFGAGYENHDLIFCQPDRKPLRRHNLTQRDFRKVLERASLPHV
jgi:hypothetical protein